MGKVVELKQFRRTRKLVSFQREELRRLLGVYSARVARGEWKDYAIDHGVGMAVFSVFRHTHDAPLFRIAKVAQRGGEPEWMILQSQTQKVKRAPSLDEALDYLDRKLEVVR